MAGKTGQVLPDYLEAAFARGDGAIIHGKKYTRRDDVPAEWFQDPVPAPGQPGAVKPPEKANG